MKLWSKVLQIFLLFSLYFSSLNLKLTKLEVTRFAIKLFIYYSGNLKVNIIRKCFSECNIYFKVAAPSFKPEIRLYMQSTVVPIQSDERKTCFGTRSRVRANRGESYFKLRGRRSYQPQDSFGRFVLKFSRSSESGPYHQKAPLNPPAIVLNDMLNVIIPNNKISLCLFYVYYQWQSPRTFWYVGYFLTIWAFLSKQLTGH